MGFKDLLALVLLVWLCSGHTLEVGAETKAPSSPSSGNQTSPPPPSSQTSPAPSNPSSPPPSNPSPPPPGNQTAPPPNSQISPSPPSPPPPNTLTGWTQWNVTGSLNSQERLFTTILMSNNRAFSFNLVLTNESKSSCAAVVQHNPSNTTVWVANFDSSNPNEARSASDPSLVCYLSFAPVVGLLLNSTNDKEIWSTNSSAWGTFDTLLLADNGCLFIKEQNEKTKTVWNSFAHPSDTLVKGQELMAGTSITAAQLDLEYSSGGVFYLQVDGANLTLEQDFHLADTSRFNYWFYPAPQTIRSLKLANGLVLSYGTNQNQSVPDSEGADWDYARLDSTGGLTLKMFGQAQSKELVGLHGGVCQRPGQCGPFGECLLNSTCRCPDGFTQLNNTCHRLPVPDTTNADCNSYTQIINITGLTYLTIPPASAQDDVDARTCESQCREDCTCMNALHVSRSVVDHLGVCFPHLDSMQTIRQTTDNFSSLQTLFLRISSTGIIVPPPTGGGASSRRTAAIGFAGGAGALVVALGVVSCWWLALMRRKYYDDAERGLYDSVAATGNPTSPLPPKYTYEQLVTSTSNFANRLGSGGYSSVYAGILEDGDTKIAVKKVDEKGLKDKEFMAAVATMGSLKNPNLVPLVGYCKEGKHKMLVYELVNEGRSLNWFLFNTHDSGPLINASMRRSIALGTAKGLQHLHEEYVIHGGVKPENIMIDRGMHPRLVDYGLLQSSTRFASLQSADSRGARGYMAPESMKSAPLTAKADVFSLGVVILELVSGRRCLAPELVPEGRRYLPAWGFSILSRGDNDLEAVLELADPRLDVKGLSEVDQQVLKGMTFVALCCVHEDPGLRPSMGEVVKMLEGELIVNAPPLSPALDAYARELCASVEPQGFMHSPALSENSDLRPR